MDVTMNHRMWVSKLQNINRNQEWMSYNFEYAEDIIGKQRRYKKDADWDVPDYQFKQYNMNSWITFFGICIINACIEKSNMTIQIIVNKQNIKNTLYSSLKILNFEYIVSGETIIISDIQLCEYMKTYLMMNTYLPEWCFKLSKTQTQLLINSMQLNDFCSTPSEILADNFMQLCLHAGYACDKINIDNIWKLNIIKTYTYSHVNDVNQENTKTQKEYIYDYNGPVFCVEVNSGVFMIRSNGKTCWTGNSRAKGPINMLTRQACEGRSKDGGFRCGESSFCH
jgi:hypothetical protein